MAKYHFRLLLLSSALAIANSVPIAQDSIIISPEPINNGNETIIKQWVPEPKTRGTFRIIFSCCVTLFLCVWTTVHVNIEPTIPEDDGDNIFMKIDKFLAKRAIKKSGWSIVSLFVPEVALAVAAYERSTAIILKEKVEEVLKKRARLLADKGGAEQDQVLLYSCSSTLQQPPNTLPPVDSSVANTNTTLVYSKIRARCLLSAWKDESVSYYAVMGGFRIVCNPTEYVVPGSCPGRVGPIEKRFMRSGDDEAPHYVPSGDDEEPHCRTLTPWGVLRLAEMNLLPHVPVEVIKDKSKVNVLAKLITVFQALWMILQVIARAAAGQEVTLLEAHTVLHLICAAAMYLTWWNKPADIDLPTDIALSEEVYRDLVNSPLGTVQEDPTSPLTPSGKKKAGAGGSGKEEAGAASSDNKAGAGGFDQEAGAGGSGKEEAGAGGFDKEVGAVSSDKGDAGAGSTNPGVTPSIPPAGNARGATSEITAPSPDKTITPLPSKAAAPSPHKIEAPSPSKYVTTRAGLGKLISVQLFHGKHKGNIADKYFSAIGTGFGRALKAREKLGKELATLCIIGVAYGGGHLATWKNTFPSPAEQWMWKACAILTSIAVAAFVLMLALSAIIDRLMRGGIAERPLYRFIVGIIFGVGIFVVLVARTFLLVESFLSLRYLNEESFQAVAWAHTWPHLG